MFRIRQYFFDDVRDSRGRIPLTRWDVFLSLGLALALGAAVGYSTAASTGWSVKRGVLVAGTIAFSLGAAQHRRIVITLAFAFIAVRAVFGAVTTSNPTHILILMIVAATCALFAWVIGRRLNDT